MQKEFNGNPTNQAWVFFVLDVPCPNNEKYLKMHH